LLFQTNNGVAEKPVELFEVNIYYIRHERTEMMSRVAHSVIVIMLVLSMGSGWVCAAMNPVAWESHCNKDQVLNHDTFPMQSKPCNMSSCGATGDCVFISPDTSSSRFERDPRGKAKVDDSLDGLKTMQVSFRSLWVSGGHLRRILPLANLPLFLANCSFLC
jgi:hypothetical protein